jgi:superfamily II DNA or RNA helicase
LGEHLQSFTAAELYLLFQQNGSLQSVGKAKPLIDAIATGRFPQQELAAFLRGEPSLADALLSTHYTSAIAVGADEPTADCQTFAGETRPLPDASLPSIGSGAVLASLESPVVVASDTEAVAFLLASAKEKLWRAVFPPNDELTAVAEIEQYIGGIYATRVKEEFLTEYRAAVAQSIPLGYSFHSPPNLMQRLLAVRVQEARRVGNWSGTGAGKTLSAILATRVVDAGLTIVCCPNAVVDGWKNAILDIFPNSIVQTKTLAPDWGQTGAPRYLVLNYETFQQPHAQRELHCLLRERVDFIVLDEVHFTKQRHSEDVSKRKKVLAALVSGATSTNARLHVLGMSATPIINNLYEGKSLIEVITGLQHDDLKTRPTVSNAMRMHQRLATLGIRWMPDYGLSCSVHLPRIDCSTYLDEVRKLRDIGGSPLSLEQILTRARLPAIRSAVRRKTLIYTYYVAHIDRILADSLRQDGWNVGFYTGDDKSGLDGFISGDVDILIGSSAISTGLDGLQQVCSRLIVNVLPWTNAEFEQLRGRIFRQGQQENVEVVIPLTFAEVRGKRWSWCEAKLRRLQFKESIADAAVDGVVPEGHLRSPAQAYRDVMGWLARLEAGELNTVERRPMVGPLLDGDARDSVRRRRYGDFSAMNQRWNGATSAGTHQRLGRNPEEWEQYHTLYREARKEWAVVPYERIIEWCRRREGYSIGDFGCGEALLAEALAERHTVHSFDHVAINPNVIACDMAHVPLDDETLDVAVFCLSLMGNNFTDYILEAYRTLKLDGQLHVIEKSSRFSSRDSFAKDLACLGFAVIAVTDIWKFTHIRAIKTERSPTVGFRLAF